MTRSDRPVGDHVTWDGSSRAVDEIRDLVIGHASAGTLRIILQQLTLREGGRAVGVHEVIDAVTDVGGNLVTIPLIEAVRADVESSTRLDAAIARLRADIAADVEAEVDGLEVVLDGDRRRQVRIVLALEISPEDVSGGHVHPALHDGAHHIHHHAPVLDDLRDRLSGPPPSMPRRVWDALREQARGWIGPRH
jgi:hypothetical protein